MKKLLLILIITIPFCITAMERQIKREVIQDCIHFLPTWLQEQKISDQNLDEIVELLSDAQRKQFLDCIFGSQAVKRLRPVGPEISLSQHYKPFIPKCKNLLPDWARDFDLSTDDNFKMLLNMLSDNDRVQFGQCLIRQSRQAFPSAK